MPEAERDVRAGTAPHGIGHVRVVMGPVRRQCDAAHGTSNWHPGGLESRPDCEEHKGQLAAVMVVAALGAVLTGAGTAAPGSPGGGAGEVSIFYYPWYGTEAQDGEWQHWQQNDNAPPFDDRLRLVPALEARTRRRRPRVVRAQMREIAAAASRR